MKKIVFAYIVFLLLSSEAISFIAYYIYQGKAFSYSELNNYRTSIASQTQSNFATQPIVAHPYLGNVHNPDSTARMGEIGVNEYGFMDDKNSIQKRQKINT